MLVKSNLIYVIRVYIVCTNLVQKITAPINFPRTNMVWICFYVFFLFCLSEINGRLNPILISNFYIPNMEVRNLKV